MGGFFYVVDLEIFSGFGHSKPLTMSDNGYFFCPRFQSYLSNLVSLGSLKPYTLGLKPNIISSHCNLDLVSHFIFSFHVSCSINYSMGDKNTLCYLLKNLDIYPSGELNL